MMGALYAIGAFVIVLIGFAILYRRIRSGRVGPGVYGASYDLLQQEKRQAVEIIVSEKAGARDHETADDPPI